MKHMRNVWAVLASLAAALCLTLTVGSVRAEEYTFTVRVFAGNQGTIDGSDMYEKKKIRYGETFTFSVNDVKVTNADKYYAKGLRYAGDDNDDMIGPSVELTVTSDVDLVVTYGVKGKQVPYTIRYVNSSNGKELAKEETFNGNIGDTPVLACRHIEGYEPVNPSIDAVLTDGDNVFEFKYKKVETGSGEGKTTVVNTTTVIDGGTETVVINQGSQQTPAVNPAPSETDTPEASPAPDGNKEQEAEEKPAENTDEKDPKNDVPAAENNTGEAEQTGGTHSSGVSPVLIGGGAGAAVLIGILAVLFARFRNRA